MPRPRAMIRATTRAMASARAVLTAAGLAFVAACAGGCGHARAPTPYARAFSEAERAETAGRFADAAARYGDAVDKAPTTRERDHAAYAAATMYVRAGDVARARARLEPLAAERPEGEHTARAIYDLASLRVASGDEAGGYADLERMMLTFPNHGLARRALERLCVQKDGANGGQAATIAWLDRVEPQVDRSELAESVLYQRAKRLEATGKVDAAHDAFLAIASRFPYPFGATFDDSLYHAADLDERRGRYAEAIAHLEGMLRERESSSLMGTYERPRYVPAVERIARIYADDLHDHENARATWHRLYTDFPTSIERDDALWNEAALWREDGDAPTACARLATLVSDFPDSRYVPCASARCPATTRPKKSSAPKTCPPYILEGRRKNGP